ncbi:MAG: hypothetical protein GY775_15845 [Candidatus Scalindua sp.]|nr:hypothetical protein [Candidatus Scalindua sp.]
MAWMTTTEIKNLLGITDATYDTQIDTFNPIAQARVEHYILPCVINESNSETLPTGFQPAYARMVWLMLNEGSITVGAGNVKSQSFDGQSITYGDTNSQSIASTSDQQLLKFKPLKGRYH